jgi:hypothetical protein
MPGSRLPGTVAALLGAGGAEVAALLGAGGAGLLSFEQAAMATNPVIVAVSAAAMTRKRREVEGISSPVPSS